MPPDADLDPRTLREVIDVLIRAIVVTDATGAIRLWNKSAERLYGWTEAEVLGTSIFEILGPDAQAEGSRIFEALLSVGEFRGQHVVAHVDGGTVDVASIIRPLLDDGGELRFLVGATDDLAELAALEAETQALSAHLRLALDAGGLGTWRWDLASGVTEWDAAMERVFGLEPGTFDGTFDAWKALIHPDDVDEVVRVVDDAVANRTRYRLEHRVVSPDGRIRWIEGAGQVTLDPAGNVTGTIGCSHDISERARVAEERERLAAVALEALARERVQRERLELVASVNEVLEDADDLADLMARVTQAVVPRLGDWCTLHVLESATATVPLVEIAHTDPAMVRLGHELQATHPYDPDAALGIPAVIRTGEAVFYPTVDEALISGFDVGTGDQQILRDLGLRSVMTVPLLKRGRSLGAMRFVMAQGHRPYTDEDLILAKAIAARIASTLDNRRLRQQRERTARTDAALAALGRRLAAAASVDDVLTVIGQNAPNVLGADLAEVWLALDAERLTIAGPTPRTVPISEPGPLAAAFTQAETILHQEGGGRQGAEPSDEEISALVASPLYDDVHETMGVLVLTWSTSTTFDEVDLNSIETLSRLCGQAIVRAQLAGHTEELAELAASLAAARTTMEVARLLREHSRSNLRTSVANLRLIDFDRGDLVPVLPSDVPAEIARNYERVSVEGDLPLNEAVREQHPVLIANLEDYHRRYPAVALEAERAGLGATAALPLCDSDGEVMGTLALGWPAAVRFDQRFRSRLTTLSDLASQTLERVRLFEAEHAVIASMQRRLLTPLPVVEGLDMAAHYEPATSAVGMGGDWYEAVPLPDGSVVVIVGDVVGHGVDAVAAMSQIQHLLTGLLHAGTPLSDVLALADAMIIGPEPTFATALLLHVDPAGHRVGYSNAGHPPAMVCAPGGSVRLLDQNQHPMFGLDLQPHALVYEPLPPGSRVLAYTDGLVERRGETIDEGIARLVGILERSGSGEVQDALEKLVESIRTADPAHRATTDDVAVVLISVAD